jgi:hypothetical protein
MPQYCVQFLTKHPTSYWWNRHAARHRFQNYAVRRVRLDSETLTCTVSSFTQILCNQNQEYKTVYVSKRKWYNCTAAVTISSIHNFPLSVCEWLFSAFHSLPPFTPISAYTEDKHELTFINSSIRVASSAAKCCWRQHRSWTATSTCCPANTAVH